MGLRDLKDLREPLEMQVHQDSRGFPGQMDSRVSRVSLEHRDYVELMDSLGHRVSPDQTGQTVNQAHKVPGALMVRLEAMEPLG